MSTMSLVEQLNSAIKNAMRAKEASLLITLRMLKSDILLICKDKQIDQPTDELLITCTQKMIKQRKESIKQFTAANELALAEKENTEIVILQAFLPEPLSESEVTSLIDAAFAELSPAGMRDMGKVLAHLKAQLAGRADMGSVSQLVKARLTAG